MKRNPSKLVKLPRTQIKQLIRVNASDLFRRRGYQNTTMDQIAESLHISKVWIYRYWNSKEDILFEAVRLEHKELINNARTILAGNGSPDDKLRLLIVNHIRVVYSSILPVSGELIHPETFLSLKHKRTIIKLRDEYEKLFRGIVTEGIQRGWFIECNPKLICFAIFGATNWVRTWFSHQGPISFEEVIEYLSKYLMNGIRVQKNQRRDLK